MPPTQNISLAGLSAEELNNLLVQAQASKALAVANAAVAADRAVKAEAQMDSNIAKIQAAIAALTTPAPTE